MTYGPELKLEFLWQKKLGPAHIAGSSGKTLCGCPMLGNNYNIYLDINNLNICEDCLTKYEKRRKK